MTCDMWFGTKEFSTWVPTPLSGADVSPVAWGSSGEYLNGGGWSINSFNSHKTYDFSWRSTSTRETAQLMKSFFEGSYGRGKLYFQDPLTLDMNVFPARWADPSITLDYEGPSLVPDVEPSRVLTSGFEKFRLPAYSASFDLTGAMPQNLSAVDLNDSNSVYIPIPDGFALALGANYTTTHPGEAGVFYTQATSGGNFGTTVEVPPLSNTSGLLSATATKPSGVTGVYVWIGKTDFVNAQVTVSGMTAKLYPIDRIGNIPTPLRWFGGQGNAGVRFSGAPSYINHTGVNGGQVELAATFVESVI